MQCDQSDILIVDDDTTVVELLVTSLREAGYDVCVAYDGNSALLAIELHRPILVLLDVHMPGLSGQDVLSQLWWHRLNDVPVVMMTADAQAAQTAVSTSAVDCILKPFTLDTVLSCVARHTNHANN